MTADRKPIPPGLHFVATPIGTARDITLRALDVLAGADAIAAEDTRTLRHLLEIHGVPLAGRPLIPFHDHNWEAARPRLMRILAEGKSLAYASEAGTPLVADPGYQLARAAIEAGIAVHTAPGPSAVLAALTVSGLPSDRFMFAGFPPATASARRKWLADLAAVPATLIFFESPKRVQETLAESVQIFGKDRQAVLCRELTKRFEEVTRGTLGEVSALWADRAVKGEIVVLIDRAQAAVVSNETMEDALRKARATMTLKDAAAAVAEAYDLPRRDVYQAALRLEDE